MEENENVAYCFASAYIWAKMYYDFSCKSVPFRHFTKGMLYWLSMRYI